MLKFIWKYIDVLCFLAAAFFIVWGFFRLSITAGIALIMIGLITEMIAS